MHSKNSDCFEIAAFTHPGLRLAIRPRAQVLYLISRSVRNHVFTCCCFLNSTISPVSPVSNRNYASASTYDRPKNATSRNRSSSSSLPSPGAVLDGVSDGADVFGTPPRNFPARWDFLRISEKLINACVAAFLAQCIRMCFGVLCVFFRWHKMVQCGKHKF